MDFTPTEEEAAVRDLARRLFDTGTPAPDGQAGVAGFDEALWARLGESGLLGLDVAEALGGGGLRLAEAAVVAEEAGRAAARVPVVPLLAAVTMLGLDHAELAGAAVGGTTLVVPAFGEAGYGDPSRPSVRATADGAGVTLTGSRLAVAWARQSAYVVVPATTAEGEVLLALVATDAPGITLTDEDATSFEPHATVDLAGASGTVLATGQAALEAALTRSVLLTCAHATGLAEEALRQAAAHTSTREQFGRPLATFQTITYQLADRWIDTESIRATMQQAVWRVDAGLPAAAETATAAFWASEGLQRVVGTAVHLHGGLGVDISYPLHRWFLAGKVDELALGGASRQLERLGELIAAG